MVATIPEQSQWLRAHVKSHDVRVDKENKQILGMVLAQEGVFLEDDPRGVFDQKSLKKIVTLARKKRGGLKSRFTHPSLSGDGLGSFLGRVKNVRMDNVTVERDEGIVSLFAVRGDLHLAESSFDTPNGNLGQYVLDLADEDPDALSSSLVLKPEEEEQLGEDGKPDSNLPPLWRPVELHASDIVDQGAAVDGLLSAEIAADGLPDALVRQGCELLSNFLPGQPREIVEARLQAWLGRALSLRFGDEESEEETFSSFTVNIPQIGDPYPPNKSEPLAEDIERERRHKRRERVLVKAKP